MNTPAPLCCASLALLFVGSAAMAQEQKPEQAARPPMLPPGMARADNPQQVAALYSEKNQERVAAAQESAGQPRLTAQDEYLLALAAYRTQLVEEQRQRKIKELELEKEREIRMQAELEALKAERERQREVVVLHHQAYYTYHRWLQNRDCWRAAAYGQHHACPAPTPQPAPAAPATPSAPANIADTGSDKEGTVVKSTFP